ncbi:MAG: hypothetical protein IPJ18_08475, partial [Betaproteobacteria bacterium]|nr:hypothetical protein [Betaproteobacteria bacterium]
VGMAFVAEHGVAAQDAVLEGIEANDFVGPRFGVGYFGSFVSKGRVHLRFLVVWMWVRSESVTALELRHQISGQVASRERRVSGLPVATAP